MSGSLLSHMTHPSKHKIFPLSFADTKLFNRMNHPNGLFHKSVGRWPPPTSFINWKFNLNPILCSERAHIVSKCHFYHKFHLKRTSSVKMQHEQKCGAFADKLAYHNFLCMNASRFTSLFLMQFIYWSRFFSLYTSAH